MALGIGPARPKNPHPAPPNPPILPIPAVFANQEEAIQAFGERIWTMVRIGFNALNPAAEFIRMQQEAARILDWTRTERNPLPPRIFLPVVVDLFFEFFKLWYDSAINWEMIGMARYANEDTTVLTVIKTAAAIVCHKAAWGIDSFVTSSTTGTLRDWINLQTNDGWVNSSAIAYTILDMFADLFPGRFTFHDQSVLDQNMYTRINHWRTKGKERKAIWSRNYAGFLDEVTPSVIGSGMYIGHFNFFHSVLRKFHEPWYAFGKSRKIKDHFLTDAEKDYIVKRNDRLCIRHGKPNIKHIN
jgi:hypothetical protein